MNALRRVLANIGFLSLGILAGCERLARPADYKVDVWEKSESSYLAWGVVDKSEFSDGRLLAAYRKFLHEDAPHFRISRVVLAHDPEVLRISRNAHWQEGFNYLNPGAYNQRWNQASSEIAEFFFFNGSAIVRIKRGASVRTIQLQGERDPAMIDGGSGVRLISFGPQPNGLDLFGIANPLPSENEADRLYQLLTSSFPPGSSVSLTLRTDANFTLLEGPLLDVFSPRFPDISEEAFYATNYIYCSATSDARTGLESGCHVGYPKRRHRR